MTNKLLLLGAVGALSLTGNAATGPAAKPNIIYILADDMGYGDIAPFGSDKNRTPNLDRMAAEGLKLTCFYAAPVCTPSRAQGMTGCYAKRVSLPKVIGPVSPVGINAKEHTVAELLKKQGYSTACIGKWHLGDQPEFLPTKRGFDSYFGLPYSNDMGGQRNANAAKKGKTPKKDPTPPLPLVRGAKAVEVVTDEGQDHLEERYTDAAIKYIRDRAAAASRSQPFFLYLAHTAVHKPLHPGPNFKGKSANGAYGDWVEEIDWSVGRVLDTVRELGLSENTLIIYSSDNGPWQAGTPDQAGVTGPLRGAKGSTFEGGLRVPSIAWWPGKVPAGATTDAVLASIDLLPTLVKLAGGTVPKDNKIDGVDIMPVLLGQATESTRKAYYYFAPSGVLEAVRSGPWKLALVKQDEHKQSVPFKPDPKFVPHLYNLETDIGERTDLAANNPVIVKQLQALATAMDKDLGVKSNGPGVRPPGRVANPTGLWVAGKTPSKETIEEHYD